MFVYHKDIPNNQWNVFEIVDGHEIYTCSFTTAEKAKSYCDLMNNDIALKAQIAAVLNAGSMRER